MNCNTPGLPVHHQHPELAQTHVHRVSDAIRPSHPLSPSYSLAFNLSQHQGLFQRIGSSHQVAKEETVQRANQSILKEISPEYSLEGLMLKLKLQYVGHLMQTADSF